MNKKNRNVNVAASILFITFSLLFLILIIRFFSIQITGKVNGISMDTMAAQNYLFSDVLQAKRGTIFDQNGKIIAEDGTSYKVVAILDKKFPNHVKDPEKTASKLSKYIKMPREEMLEILKKKGLFQVEFGSDGKNISPETKNQIEDLKLPGITFIGESKRYYPNGIFASHLIGYTQTEKINERSLKQTGKMGIEKALDKELQGEDGKIQYDKDRWSYILPNSKEKINEAKNGNNVYLSIDKNIQTFLEAAINEAEKKYKPKKIIAVVADPKTGKILGMGQRPTFDPSTRDGINNSWYNEVLETSYEPGSTMKIFTLAAAIEQGVFNPNAKYNSGVFKVGSATIRDHNNGIGWGNIPYLEGLQRSSNVAFARLLDLIGHDTYRKYLNDFHFGKATDIGLPNESNGKILYNYPIERYTTAFGQGTTVTALQLVQAATAIANDGKMMKPYVVEKIVDPNNGKVQMTKPEVVDNPISADTAKQVRDYLRTVVSNKESGSGQMYDIPGYDIAGKTGTAQIPNPNGKGYLGGWNNYIFSFLGMAPKDDPKLIVYVAIEQPELDESKFESGASAVKMIFNPVMENSLNYLNIKPNEENRTQIQQLEAPDLTSKSLEESELKLKETNLQVVVLGKGNTVIDQLPQKRTLLLEGEKIFLKTDGDLFMPNMENWSRKHILTVSKLLDLNVNIDGTGYLTNQSIPPNTLVKEGDSLKVTLKPSN